MSVSSKWRQPRSKMEKEAKARDENENVKKTSLRAKLLFSRMTGETIDWEVDKKNEDENSERAGGSLH